MSRFEGAVVYGFAFVTTSLIDYLVVLPPSCQKHLAEI